MMSKNEMKANHNLMLHSRKYWPVGKYDVKERDESKSQLSLAWMSEDLSWQI